MKKQKAITLISLVITIIILIILATIGINLAIGENGLINKTEYAKEENNKEAATEKINLKITNTQMETYTQEQRMPTLQEFADDLCEDSEIQYVELESKKVGSLEKIKVGEAESIFTKLKQYPYEFEINSSLQLASIDGIKVATVEDNSNWKLWQKGVGYTSEENAITLPTNFKELLIEVENSDNNGDLMNDPYSYSIIILKEFLKDYYKLYSSGYAYPNYIIGCSIAVNKENIYLASYLHYNNNHLSTGVISVYYK